MYGKNTDVKVRNTHNVITLVILDNDYIGFELA